MTLANVALVLAIVAVGAVIVALPFVMWWLQKYFKLSAQKGEIDKRQKLQQERNWFIEARLIPFAASKAEQWLIMKLPGLLKDGTSFSWSEHWPAFNTFVKTAVVKKFGAEEVDVIEYLTEPVLMDIVARIALKSVKTPAPAVIQSVPEEYRAIFGGGFLDFIIKYGDSLVD